MKKILVGFVVLAMGCGDPDRGGGSAGTVPPPSPNNATVRRVDPAELTSGGFVIYFRHATQGSYPEGTTTEQFYEWDRNGDCVQGSGLIQKGIDEATAIGNKFTSVGIPIGKIYASIACRSRETMQYAFGRITEVISYLLHFDDGLTEAEKEQKRQNVHELLSTPVPLGENTVICAHKIGDNLGIPLAKTPRLDRGDAAIYLPNADGTDYSLVGMTEVGVWTAP